MKRRLRLPKHLEGKTIEGCWECPFYDGGDSGYGDHCNVKTLEKRLREDGMYDLDADIWTCPYLEEITEEEKQ